jgi:hypothetical protein
MNKEDCRAFNNSQAKNNKGEIVFINPISKRPVKLNGPIYKKIKKQCDRQTSNTSSYDMHAYIDKWLDNPLYSPLSNKDIIADVRDKSDYATLYDIAYKHFIEKHYSKKKALKLLPKNHVLFNGKLDILAYRIDKANVKKADAPFYEFFDARMQLLHNFNDFKSENKYYQNDNPFEAFIIHTICMFFTEAFINYLKYVEELLSNPDALKNTEDKSSKLADIRATLQFVHNFVKYLDIYGYFKNALERNKTYSNMLETTALSQIVAEQIPDIEYNVYHSNNVFDTLLKYYDEIYDIYNYKKAPKKSPFDNIKNEKLTIIEDPLITILKSIGIDNIDLATLQIPERIFKNNQEYLYYSQQYTKLRQQYKNANSKPILRLPNGLSINVIDNPLPMHMDDDTYDKIVDIYNRNKATIDMYRALLDKGYITLLRKSKKKVPSAVKELKLVYKDRKFFEENSCNIDIDVLSDEKFDKNYPLYKMQLMYRLPTKDADCNTVHTDCFYAPNFYNYLVKQINNDLPLINPITKAPLTQKNIDSLMKIMKALVPKIKKPELIKPFNDRELQIDYYQYSYKNNKYYKVYLRRTIGDIDYLIYNVCTIPANIKDMIETINSEGKEHVYYSNEISSDVLLNYIIKLFNNGRLLYTHAPPYFVKNNVYLRTNVNFDIYKTEKQWDRPVREQMKMFISLIEDVKKYMQ